MDSTTNTPLPDALITVDGSGSQHSDILGRAAFLASPGNTVITINKQGFKTFTKNESLYNSIDLTVKLQRASNFGLQDNDKGNSVRIFPNPAGKSVTIEAGTTYQLEIYTPDGRVVLRHSMQQPRETIDLTGLVNGVYVIHFSGKGDGFVRKLIVTERIE
jgi:hypothetical protein